jgi:hypothetical protein
MPIPAIVIRQIRVDGAPLDTLSLKFLVYEPAYGVELRGDSLICRVPCGFSTEQGNYIFDVSAEGYPAQERGYDARYRVFKGGCPSYNDEGTWIGIRLRRG